jgi:hypothetical protein
MLQQLRLCPVTHCYVLKSVAISTFMSLRVLYRHGSSLPRRSKPASGSRLGTLSQTEPSRSVTFSVTPRRFRHSPPSISFQCPRVCSSNRRSASKERSSEMVSSPSLRRSSVIPAQAGIQSCPCHRDVTTTTAVPCYTTKFCHSRAGGNPVLPLSQGCYNNYGCPLLHGHVTTTTTVPCYISSGGFSM